MTRPEHVLLAACVAALSLGCPDDSPGPPRIDGGSDADVPPSKRPDVYVDPDLAAAQPVSLQFEEISLDAETLAVTEIRFVPGTSEFLVLEKDGRVLHFALEEDTTRLLGTFEIPNVFPQSDCGLVAAAFDPDFETNGYVYFGYCIAQQYSVVTRHVFDAGDYGQIGATTAEILRVGDPRAPKSWHNVGSIGFDPDGNLWALFGEKRLEEEAQNTANELGTLVRVVPNRDPDGEGHEPAADNPYLDDATKRPSIYAYGLRSPWKGSLDSRGRFWVGDVGAADVEEVNVVTEAGQNFGWPEWEGPCEANCVAFTQPLTHWNRSSESDYALDDPETPATDRRVVWVGPEYRARGGTDRYDGRLTGRTLFGDFCAGWVRAAELDDQDRLVFDGRAGHLAGVTGIDEGPDGFLYFVTYGNCHTFPYRAGKLWRATLVP